MKNATPMAFWGPRAQKMQPLLHCGDPGLEKCNPYCILGPQAFRNATSIALLVPTGWAEKEAPVPARYPSSQRSLVTIGSPIAFGPPGSWKMQPILHFRHTGPRQCNPYCMLGPRGPENATPIALWPPGAGKMQPPFHFASPGPGKCNPYCILAPRGSEIATPIAFCPPGAWKM